MKEYRITKYDPQYRDDSGVFTKPEWTMFSDIGETIGGHVVSESEYERIESAYINAALHFLNEAGIDSLIVRGLENHGGYPTAMTEGQTLSTRELQTAFREILREKCWCCFERDGMGFVHFGYDYYMYVGVSRTCTNSIRYAEEQGLFVEEFRSPYHPEDEG